MKVSDGSYNFKHRSVSRRLLKRCVLKLFGCFLLNQTAEAVDEEEEKLGLREDGEIGGEWHDVTEAPDEREVTIGVTTPVRK